MMEDNLWWKMTFDGGQPLMEDDLQWKITFDRGRPLIDDDLWWKTSFDGRQPLMEDDFWWKTIMGLGAMMPNSIPTSLPTQLCGIFNFWYFFYIWSLDSSAHYFRKYQPSGAWGTRSPPATPYRLLNPKWPTGGPKMANGVWKGVQFLVIGRSDQLSLNKFFDWSTPSMRKVRDRETSTILEQELRSSY